MSDPQKTSPLPGAVVTSELDQAIMAPGRQSDKALAAQLQCSVEAIMARRAQLLEQMLQLLRGYPRQWVPPSTPEVALSRLMKAQERVELVEMMVRDRWQRDSKALRRFRVNWTRERDQLRKWMANRPR